MALGRRPLGECACSLRGSHSTGGQESMHQAQELGGLAPRGSNQACFQEVSPESRKEPPGLTGGSLLQLRARRDRTAKHLGTGAAGILQVDHLKPPCRRSMETGA